jgi:regulator of RNase E activity RraA
MLSNPGEMTVLSLTPELRAELQSLDTPTVCNALEALAPARRGYGYTTKPLFCARPGLPPLVGLARTASIRSAHPSDLKGNAARELSDAYYAYIDEGPKPCVAVIHDMDQSRGYGAFWGEVNSAIHKGLGCEGVITDGAVRDLPDVAEGFQMLAGRVVPSHAFVHLVEFGRPIDVAGMRVGDGDLIHADQHGAVVIPHDVAAAVKEAARLLQARERVIIQAARQPGFNLARLRAAQGEAAQIH